MIRSNFLNKTLLAVVTTFLAFILFMPQAYGSPESDAARNKAKEILKQKQYQDNTNPPLSDKAERISRWLGGKSRPTQNPINNSTKPIIQSRSAKKMPPEPPASGLGIAAIIILVIIGVLILAVVIFFIVKTRLKSRHSKKQQPDIDIEDLQDLDWSDEENVLETISDADVLEQLANQAREAGKYDIALRYLFRAGLLRLNDNNIISFHPSVTNAQWQLFLSNHLFDELTIDFNDVTYGKYVCTIEQVIKAQRQWPNIIQPQQKDIR